VNVSSLTAATASEDSTYFEKVYSDPADTIFWYGFGQGLVQFFSGVNQALSVTLTSWLSSAWDAVTGSFTVVIRSEVAAEYSEEDIKALENTGLSETEIASIVLPVSCASKTSDTTGNAAADTRNDYDLTYYINDVNTNDLV